MLCGGLHVDLRSRDSISPRNTQSLCDVALSSIALTSMGTWLCLDAIHWTAQWSFSALYPELARGGRGESRAASLLSRKGCFGQPE